MNIFFYIYDVFPPALGTIYSLPAESAVKHQPTNQHLSIVQKRLHA